MATDRGPTSRLRALRAATGPGVTSRPQAHLAVTGRGAINRLRAHHVATGRGPASRRQALRVATGHGQMLANRQEARHEAIDRGRASQVSQAALRAVTAPGRTPTGRRVALLAATGPGVPSPHPVRLVATGLGMTSPAANRKARRVTGARNRRVRRNRGAINLPEHRGAIGRGRANPGTADRSRPGISRAPASARTTTPIGNDKQDRRMVTHLVLMKPRPDLSPADRQALLGAFERAIREIPTVLDVRVGRRIVHGAGYEQAAPDAADYLVVIDFNDLAGLQTYLRHPAARRAGSAVQPVAQLSSGVRLRVGWAGPSERGPLEEKTRGGGATGRYQ